MFQVWTSSGFHSGLAEVAVEARRAEAMGYDCFAVVDSVHDGLMGAALAAQATRRIEIATCRDWPEHDRARRGVGRRTGSPSNQ